MSSLATTSSGATPLKSVYLSGPITGLHYAECADWRVFASRRLAPEILAYSPLRAQEELALAGVIRSSYEGNPLTCSRGLTARDRFDCQTCDLLLCNLLGATEVSVGTCIELGWADAFRKPIVLIMEPDHNVHDHPLVRGVCAFRVPLLEEGLQVARAILLP